MKKILFGLLMVILLAVGFTTNAVAQSNGLISDLAKTFKRVEVVKLNAAQIKQSRILQLNLDGQAVRIVLEPNDLRSPALQKEEGAIEITTYRGKIVDEPDSVVRVSFISEGVEVLILRNGETFCAQPAVNFSIRAGTDDTVVFNTKNAIGETYRIDNVSRSISRMVERARRATPESYFQKASFSPASTANSRRRTPFYPMKTLELQVYSDREWLVYYGSLSASLDAINAQLNAAEAVYESELGITFSVLRYSVWTKSWVEDDYTTAGNTIEVDLGRFHSHNNPDWLQINEDAAILFTTVSYSGYWGAARDVGAACSAEDQAIVRRPPPGYPSVQGFIVAHELGHLIGANHTPETTDPQWYLKIMHPDLDPASQMTFYSGSVLEIQDFVTSGQGANCIN